MSTPVLSTPRLVLVPVSLDDVDFVQAEFPHWEIVRLMNLLVPWPYPPDGALTFYRDVLLPKIARGHDHAWTIRLRESGTLIGVVSVASPPAEENRGFWIARAFQRRGFAREAADAASDFYFRVLEQLTLRASKAIANAASRRITEAQGMRVVWRGEKDYVSGRHQSEVWEITREEWLARK